MKIQPVDVDEKAELVPVRLPLFRSRLRRIFERQFFSAIRISSSEKLVNGEALSKVKDGETEVGSVSLDKMVQNYIDDSTEKPTRVRHRCNCFNPNADGSDDELDCENGDASEHIKSLVSCASVAERNVLAEVVKIIENKNHNKPRGDLKKIVAVGLASIGYDSAICRSKWDKTSTYPAGEHEYIDVNIDGDRIVIDIDFRSEFEIARPTGAYKTILQFLPGIFVGKPDRLSQIVSIVSDAAKQSLKKKGMHFPPWRKADYMKEKWLSSFTRGGCCVVAGERDDCGELDLIFGSKTTHHSSPPVINSGDGEKEADARGLQPSALRRAEGASVTGLASLLKEKP